MNAVQPFQPSTSSVVKLSFIDKLINDLSSIVDDEVWSDIEVKVHGKSSKCHKSILAARSSYFNGRLRSDPNLTVIVERNGNADAFELVRRYIYTGTVTYEQADEELIANVLCLSIKYMLDELTNFMTDQMRKRITVKTAVKIFQLMSGIKLQAIADECLEFIGTHGVACLQNEMYIDLNLSQLVCLLKQTNLSAETEYTVVRKWGKKPGADASKLFRVLDGEIDCDDGEGTSGKQYVLLNGDGGEMVILDGETFDQVLTRKEPTTTDSQIAVCNEIMYVIDTKNGEIQATAVSSLLKSEAIQWNKCANFQSSEWSQGNVAVVDSVIYFMGGTHIYKFDTNSKTVTKLYEFGTGNDYYSLVQVDGIIYGYRDNKFQFTDGLNEWKTIDLPASFGPYPYFGSLFKTKDSVCLVGGYDGHCGYLSSLLCYDTKSKSWSQGKHMKEARDGAATVSLDERRTLVAGGWNGIQWMDTIELFDDHAKEWSLIDYKFKLEYHQAVTFYI